jgi:hypothetical protein
MRVELALWMPYLAGLGKNTIKGQAFNHFGHFFHNFSFLNFSPNPAFKDHFF